jgi:hypothetical protein
MHSFVVNGLEVVGAAAKSSHASEPTCGRHGGSYRSRAFMNSAA